MVAAGACASETSDPVGSPPAASAAQGVVTTETPITVGEAEVPTSTATAEYEGVAAPPMPGTTEPVPPPGEAYDGVYFAYLHEGPGSEDPERLRFDVVQAFSGVDCAIRFGDEAPQVCTPIGTEPTGPTARVEPAVTEVPISVRDVNSQASYSISGEELLALVRGAAPAASAPAGFAFSGGFGFLLTYDAGVLIRIDQPAAAEPL